MEATEDQESGHIVHPRDVLPPQLHLFVLDKRPLFPGQALPLVVLADEWGAALRAARTTGQSMVGLVLAAPSAGNKKIKTKGKLCKFGTVCRIHGVRKYEDHLQVMLEGMQRFSIEHILHEEAPLVASVKYPPAEERANDKHKAYAVAIINTIKELIPLNPLYGEELKTYVNRFDIQRPGALADFAAALTTVSNAELQDILQTVPLMPRLEKTIALLAKEVQIAQAQFEIRSHVEKEVETRQKEVFLREQLKFIQKELGLAKDGKTSDIEEFRARLEWKTLPEDAAELIEAEMNKLSMLDTASSEFSVTRNYLDWLTILPWGLYSEDNKDLDAAVQILESGHYGVRDVKDRLIEFLAVGIARGDVSGSILLFVGPPGCGKTSLGKSIAKALGRQFYRFSVGGMRDEAEIKGHRRTYVGAFPGKMIQALRDTGKANPVIMIDEVDKMGMSYQGDPASALLDVLDPEQNAEFRDHYLDVHFDLSKILFICTANQLDSIPLPLLDRMEILHLPGYLDDEKMEIARRHLLPRQIRKAGLQRRGDLRVEKRALRRIITNYAREPGVRRLEKMLARICRRTTLALVKGGPRPQVVRAPTLQDLLGPPPFQRERPRAAVGVVTGLAWTSMGGTILSVEATLVHTRRASCQVTGQLGDVMRESLEIAYSFVRSNAKALGAVPAWFDDAGIHLHVPAGATPKDGPSAGIAMASALLSLATGRKSKRGVAMTGELTLTGDVYPVGGIREKLLAAQRSGIATVVLPSTNESAYMETPETIRASLQVHFVSHFSQVVELLFAN